MGQNLTPLIVKATGVLAVVGFLPFAVVIVFGPSMFGFVFGSEWVEAGIYARWVALMLFFLFINKPAISSVPVLRIQKGYMYFGFISAGIKIAALYLGFIIYHTATKAIALFSVLVPVGCWLVLWL